MARTIDWTQATWADGYAAVQTMTDALGMPVDTGIVETVVALNLLGFQTLQSCEGHLDHGTPYPWVTLIHHPHHSRFIRAWKQVCDLQEEARHLGTPEAYERLFTTELAFRLEVATWKRDDTLFSALIKLLDTFYADRPIPPTRLMVLRMHPGMSRIEPGSGRQLREAPEPVKRIYLLQAQTEMQTFTAFLKRLLLEQKRIKQVSEQLNPRQLSSAGSMKRKQEVV
jgi:hypothetical protein